MPFIYDENRKHKKKKVTAPAGDTWSDAGVGPTPYRPPAAAAPLTFEEAHPAPLVQQPAAPVPGQPIAGAPAATIEAERVRKEQQARLATPGAAGAPAPQAQAPDLTGLGDLDLIKERDSNQDQLDFMASIGSSPSSPGHREYMERLSQLYTSRSTIAAEFERRQTGISPQGQRELGAVDRPEPGQPMTPEQRAYWESQVTGQDDETYRMLSADTALKEYGSGDPAQIAASPDAMRRIHEKMRVEGTIGGLENPARLTQIEYQALMQERQSQLAAYRAGAPLREAGAQATAAEAMAAKAAETPEARQARIAEEARRVAPAAEYHRKRTAARKQQRDARLAVRKAKAAARKKARMLATPAGRKAFLKAQDDAKALVAKVVKGVGDVEVDRAKRGLDDAKVEVKESTTEIASIRREGSAVQTKIAAIVKGRGMTEAALRDPKKNARFEETEALFIQRDEIHERFKAAQGRLKKAKSARKVADDNLYQVGLKAVQAIAAGKYPVAAGGAAATPAAAPAAAPRIPGRYEPGAGFVPDTAAPPVAATAPAAPLPGPVARPTPAPVKKPVKLSPAELKALVTEVLVRTGGNKEEARKILEEMGVKF